jgi:hypothetical protein
VERILDLFFEAAFEFSVVTEKAPTPPISVVLNWAVDLKK